VGSSEVSYLDKPVARAGWEPHDGPKAMAAAGLAACIDTSI
jgi:hypothetical protein